MSVSFNSSKLSSASSNSSVDTSIGRSRTVDEEDFEKIASVFTFEVSELRESMKLKDTFVNITIGVMIKINR